MAVTAYAEAVQRGQRLAENRSSEERGQNGEDDERPERFWLEGSWKSVAAHSPVWSFKEFNIATFVGAGKWKKAPVESRQRPEYAKIHADRAVERACGSRSNPQRRAD